MVIGSAIMSNIRRIQRYRTIKITQSNKKSTEMERKSTQSCSFLSFLLDDIRIILGRFAFDNRVFGF
jgi:hypothetical protein